MQLLTHQMHNFCNFYKKCQNLATSKHAPISSILSTQSLLVKYNRGSLVEQHILKKYFFPYTFGPVYCCYGDAELIGSAEWGRESTGPCRIGRTLVRHYVVEDEVDVVGDRDDVLSQTSEERHFALPGCRAPTALH